MKNTLLTFLLLFAIFSCTAQKQVAKEEKIRVAIRAQFDKNVAACSLEASAVTNFNGKTEFWSVCALQNGNRIITIQSHQEDTYNQQIYFEKNGDLIYAKETENYMPINHFTQMVWNCEFFAKNGELLTIISLGHGKTEDDEWDPDSIFKLYKTRLSELAQIKK